MTKTPKVLVVDDDAAVEMMLRPYLVDEGFAPLVARDGPEALAAVERERPDLILLDLQMPGKTGLEVLEELRRRKSEAFVILLTGRATEVDRVVGLELGADDYVTKPFSPREVVSRVKAVLRRRSSVHAAPPNGSASAAPGTIAHGEIALHPAERAVTVRGNGVALTPTEFRILEVLAAEPGRVFSRSELLDRVNADALDVSERSLDSHIAHLRRKIEPEGKPRYVLTVYGFGYKFNRAVRTPPATAPSLHLRRPFTPP